MARHRPTPGARKVPPRPVDLLLPSLNPGKAQQVFLTLARLLRDRGEVRLVVVDAGGPLRSEVPADVELVDLGCGGVRTAVRPLARHLRRSPPACLLSSMDHTNLLAVASARLARSAVPVLPRVANTASLAQRGGIPDAVIRVGSRWLYRRLRAVVVPSEGVKRDLVDLGVPEPTLRVVPNPVVGPGLFAAAAEPVRHPWLDPAARDDVPVVLGVGRLVPQKDFALLIDAFARVRRRRRARLIVLGEGPQRDALRKRAVDAAVDDDVDLPGYVANPMPYLAAADLFVLSSRWEGLPGALIQALACGTPAVATDCRSGPREILAGGRYGLLVPVGDVEALAAAVDAALSGMPAPPPEAWEPYTEASALAGYLALIQEAVTGEFQVRTG